MLTQCPNCQTTFRVTSEILRVAHGQVRCGRCHTQFDALERLIEEGTAGEVESGRYLQPPAPSQIEVDEPETQEDITLEGRHIEITGTHRVMDHPDQPGIRQAGIRQEITEEWVEIEDVDDAQIPDDSGIEVSEEFADDDAVPEWREWPDEPPDEQPDTTSREPPDEPPDTANDEDEQDRFARRLAISAARRPVDVAETEPDFELEPQRRRAPGALLWKLLAAPLVLLLIGQVVHHYRAELARHPRAGAPLMSIYNSLHIPLTPDWNLHAYEIKQWGVLSDPANPGTLKVRASITNRAEFAQPYPLLRLVLEDRWGDQVRAREFEPADYLDPATSADRLLAPRQQTNATVTIVDPGPDAEGFRFDVCLRGRKGPVCAAEVPE